MIDLGFNLAAQRSYYHYPADDVVNKRGVIATAVIASLVISCIAGALLVALAGPCAELLLDDRDYTTLVAVTALTLPIGVLAQLMREIMRLTLRPWPYLVSSMLSAGVGAATGILLVTTGSAELAEVQWGALAGAALAGVYGLAVVRGHLSFAFSRRELGIMLRYGLPLVPMGLALWGLSLIDRIILQRLDGLDEVGIYGVANRAASVSLLAVVAFATA